jgi:5-methylcytosine-specific restriction endonuclease McrA
VRLARREWEAKNAESLNAWRRNRYKGLEPAPYTCPRCGWSGEAKNYLCPECNKERSGQRFRVKREAYREHARQYYEQNKDAIVTRVRQREQAECQTDDYKAMKKAKRDWLKAGDVTWHELREIYLRDGGACVYCGTPVSVVTRPASAVGFDHVIPYSKGGQHTADNLVTCCVPCNSRKHNSLLDEE